MFKKAFNIWIDIAHNFTFKALAPKANLSKPPNKLKSPENIRGKIELNVKLFRLVDFQMAQLVMLCMFSSVESSSHQTLAEKIGVIKKASKIAFIINQTVEVYSRKFLAVSESGASGCH